METFISRWWGQEVIQYGDPLYESTQSESESWKGPEQAGVLSLIKLHQLPGNFTSGCVRCNPFGHQCANIWENKGVHSL